MTESSSGAIDDNPSLDRALAGLERVGTDEARRAREMLLDAVALSADGRNRASELQAYALRECLEAVLVIFGAPRDRTDLRKHLRGLLEAMKSSPPSIAESSDIDDASGPVDRRTGLSVAVEIAEHALATSESARRDQVYQAMAEQVGAADDSIEMNLYSSRWSETVKRLNEILHGGDHDPSEIDGLRETAIDLVASLAGPMSARLDAVDSMLDLAPPAPRHAAELLTLIADPRLRSYFFSRCDAPEWVSLLEGHGVFIAPERDPWPAGYYLRRVAASAQAEVLRISESLSQAPSSAAATSTVIGIAAVLGPTARESLKRVLDRSPYRYPQVVGREVNELVKAWTASGWLGELVEIVDLAVQAREPEDRWGGVQWKLDPFDHSELLSLVVAAIDCGNCLALLEVLLFKLKRLGSVNGGSAIRMLEVRGAALSDLEDGRASPFQSADSLVAAIRTTVLRAADCELDCELVLPVLLASQSRVADRLALAFLSAADPRCSVEHSVEVLSRAFLSEPTAESLNHAQLVWARLSGDQRVSLLMNLGRPVEAGELEQEELAPGRRVELSRQSRWLAGLPADELPSEWRTAGASFVSVLGRIEAVPPEMTAGFTGDQSPLTPGEIAAMGPERFADFVRGFGSGALDE